VTRWASLDELAAAVPDGAWIAPGGASLARAPIALIVALIRARRKHLRVISLPDPVAAELLVATGCAVRVELRFATITLRHRVHAMPAIARAIECGELAWAELDGYRITQRLRAAAMGVPFLPAPDADLSAPTTLEPPVYATDPFTGISVPVERAFHPDIALIHAHAADARGNLYIDDPAVDLLVAGAARRVIATAETRVRSLPRVTIPSTDVELIAAAPRGAWPTACGGAYARDERVLLDYVTAARAERAAAWIDAAIAPRRIRRDAA